MKAPTINVPTYLENCQKKSLKFIRLKDLGIKRTY